MSDVVDRRMAAVAQIVAFDRKLARDLAWAVDYAVVECAPSLDDLRDARLDAFLDALRHQLEASR